ncbi:hypothetical protein Hanom_Chr13g01200211 [Helianthus anomalus]
MIIAIIWIKNKLTIRIDDVNPFNYEHVDLSYLFVKRVETYPFDPLSYQPSPVCQF